MSITDAKFDKRSMSARKTVSVGINSAVGLTDAVIWSFTPGYKFEITRVRSFTRLITATVTAKIKVGTRTAVTTVVFTAGTEVGATLSTAIADLQGSSTDAITIELTSGGSGLLTNAYIVFSWRPRPQSGEGGLF